MTESFSVKPDPRLPAASADYTKQLELALKIRDKLNETHNAIIQIRDVRKQVDDLLKRVKDSGSPGGQFASVSGQPALSGGQLASGGSQPNFKVINDAASNLNKSLTSIEETLYQTKNQSSQDPLNYPIRLNNKLAALGGVVSRGDAAPTDQSYAVYDELVSQIDAQLQRLAQVLKTDVPAFNQLVREQNVPAVVVKSPRSEAPQP